MDDAPTDLALEDTGTPDSAAFDSVSTIEMGG
jgi:hypothetical protein